MNRTIPFLPQRDENPPLLEINTTPLIDVMLVLLIMLILTMPPITHAVKIDLPHGGPASKMRPAVVVGIDFDGTVYWDGVSISDGAVLDRYFQSIGKSTEQPDIRVQANRRVKYEVVAQVLAAAQRNGVAHLGFAGNEQFVNESR
jgi:biopolymer transport protein ExbD